MKKGRTFVMGDIHGAHKALIQCLERSGFDYKQDTLIQLGDVADGWHEVKECVDVLLSIKNLIAIRGNHDDWLRTFLETYFHPEFWRQGGEGTLRSYSNENGICNPDCFPESHRMFFKKQKLFYIDDKNRCFVHGGFNNEIRFRGQPESLYYWDRSLWKKAQSVKGKNNKLKTVDDFSEIFIGHTASSNRDNKEAKPLCAGGVWNLDTGTGWEGKLTIMDVKTHLYWQSDFVRTLYPGINGR